MITREISNNRKYSTHTDKFYVNRFKSLQSSLPANIRLGCKTLPRTNALAYYKNS